MKSSCCSSRGQNSNYSSHSFSHFLDFLYLVKQARLYLSHCVFFLLLFLIPPSHLPSFISSLSSSSSQRFFFSPSKSIPASCLFVHSRSFIFIFIFIFFLLHSISVLCPLPSLFSCPPFQSQFSFHFLPLISLPFIFPPSSPPVSLISLVFPPLSLLLLSWLPSARGSLTF